MKVSVIIPVYNVEQYIEKCLDSLVNQTLKDIEIIVVNDGSPDNSQKIIDKYVKKYPKKVKSYIKENGGQGSARNYGLEKATGEYIGYVDSDDYVEVDMFEKLYNKAKKTKSDITICGTYVEYPDKTITELEDLKHNDSRLNAYFGKMAVWNKIYKRELLVDNKMKFRSKLWYEDFDFSYKVISYAKKITYLNEPYYHYLIRPGSTMNNSNIHRNLEILKAFDEIRKEKENKDVQEYLAIEHIYISTTVRVINADCDKKEKRKVINEIHEYINKYYKEYKNNQYIKFMNKRRKLIYRLINLKLYNLIYIMFKIKRSI